MKLSLIPKKTKRENTYGIKASLEKQIDYYSSAILNKYPSGCEIQLTFFIQLLQEKIEFETIYKKNLKIERMEEHTNIYIGRTATFRVSRLELRKNLIDIFSSFNRLEKSQIIGFFAQIN